jgi:hypothetical protein
VNGAIGSSNYRRLIISLLVGASLGVDDRLPTY